MKREKGGGRLIRLSECINRERRNKVEYLANRKEDLLGYAANSGEFKKTGLLSVH